MRLKKIALFSALPIEYNLLCQQLNLAKKEILNEGRLTKGFLKNLECIFVLTGPGKARAAKAASSAIAQYKPDLILDTGTCATLIDDLKIGNLVLSLTAYEINLGFIQFPEKKSRFLEISSSLNNLNPQLFKSIFNKLSLPEGNYLYFPAKMACAEFCLNSLSLKQRITQIFQAQAFCWETAAIFLCAQRNTLPVLSLRVVSDRGEENFLTEFKTAIKKVMLNLADYLKNLIFSGWLEELLASLPKYPQGI